MTDLSSDAPIRIRGLAYTDKFPIDTSAAFQFWKGQPVILDIAAGDTTHVRPYVDAYAVAATDVCVGIAAEAKLVASGDPETTEIEVFVGPTIVGFLSAVFTLANLGIPVYKSDSNVLSGTVGDNPLLGKLVDVRDGYCWVELETPVICSGA
jgi:hypothetical protein